MNNLVLSPIPIEELLKQFREIIKEEIKVEQQNAIGEKLLSLQRLVNYFNPKYPG